MEFRNLEEKLENYFDLPVTPLQTRAMPQKCHSNLRIHSNGTLSNRHTMTSCPKKDVINANVTKSCITISHPGISFSRINRYSVPK